MTRYFYDNHDWCKNYDLLDLLSVIYLLCCCAVLVLTAQWTRAM